MTASADFHLGLVCHQLKDYDEAINYLTKSAHLRETLLQNTERENSGNDSASSIDIVVKVGMVYSNLAAIYLDMGNHHKAMQMVQKEKSILETISAHIDPAKIAQLNSKIEKIKKSIRDE